MAGIFKRTVLPFFAVIILVALSLFAGILIFYCFVASIAEARLKFKVGIQYSVEKAHIMISDGAKPRFICVFKDIYGPSKITYETIVSLRDDSVKFIFTEIRDNDIIYSLKIEDKSIQGYTEIDFRLRKPLKEKIEREDIQIIKYLEYRGGSTITILSDGDKIKLIHDFGDWLDSQFYISEVPEVIGDIVFKVFRYGLIKLDG